MTIEARKIRLIMELRRLGIGDTAVLSAIERIPRELFAPASFQDQAYENRALPIGQGQTLSQPLVVAAMTQALDATRRCKVLEIGTGSGYQCAVLSRLSRRVYTVERHKSLLRQAEERFTQLRLHNITARCGDGGLGWPEQAPFDRIIVTCAAPEIPETLVAQLAPGGILVVPVGATGRQQRLFQVTREGDRAVERELGAVRFVPLVTGLPDEARASETSLDVRRTGETDQGAAGPDRTSLA